MKHPGLTRLALNIAPLLALLVRTGVASADEPRKVNEPSVLNEPAEITSVVDAFDEYDPFDLHLTLGFQQTWTRGNIHRETHDSANQFSSGGFTADNVDVARYEENTSRLNTRADIGIYHDIALIARMPIILSDSRKLKDPSGGVDRGAGALDGAPNEGPLFSVPFDSPNRSGIEYLALGLDFGIFNQSRDLTKPTWVFGFEGRFNVSEPLHACNANDTPECAHPSDVNRNGSADGPLEGDFPNGSRDPGVSRGTTGLEVHTYLSKRVKYVEPYGGFSALFEFQNESSDYGTTDFKGSLVNHPPFRGSMVGGLAVIPWEIRDQFQRVELDFRLKGTYITEGRDYSPLFDALGSSHSRTLRNPNYASFTGSGNTSFADQTSQKVYFTGITDVQQHAQLMLSTQVTFQAGEYVKFNVGAGYTVEQGHVINMDQPCNPDFKNDATKSGPCRSSATAANFDVTGIPNPNYRPTINVPGRRFRYDDGTAFDAWLNATVMF